MIEFVSIPSIVVLVYLIVEVVKLCTKNEIITRLIPAISCVLGMVFGVVAFYCCPAIIPANNILSALFVGATSGLGATGTNQILKQITKTTSSQSVEEEQTQEVCEQDSNEDK